MHTSEMPLVSCICITHKRVDFLKKAVHYFQHQTYPNKELIVGYTADDEDTHKYLEETNDVSVKPLLFESATLTLGKKRNLAINFCSGFYFIVWDDDDWHHRTRIEVQALCLKGTQFKCSALSNIILYDGMRNKAYVSATRWGWEGTLLCEKSVINESCLRYAEIDRAEDSPLLYQLKMNDLLMALPKPKLYIYYYHGKNTCHRGHWEVNFFPWAEELPPDQASIIKEITEGRISHSEASDILNNFT